MTKDTHIGLEQGIDFVRGHVQGDEAAQMQAHLEECGQCRHLIDILRSAVEVADREKKFETPESDTHCAKALFSAFGPKISSRLSLAFGRMTNFSRPALEGVRGAGGSTSHYLFEDGTVLLDFQIESSAAHEMVSAAGQILDKDRRPQGYGHRPVALMRGETEVARTVTDQFGAFRLEYKPQPDLLVVIGLDEDSYYVSRLPSAA